MTSNRSETTSASVDSSSDSYPARSRSNPGRRCGQHLPLGDRAQPAQGLPSPADHRFPRVLPGKAGRHLSGGTPDRSPVGRPVTEGTGHPRWRRREQHRQVGTGQDHTVPGHRRTSAEVFQQDVSVATPIRTRRRLRPGATCRGGTEVMAVSRAELGWENGQGRPRARLGGSDQGDPWCAPPMRDYTHAAGQREEENTMGTRGDSSRI